ncbi:maltose acetyltransferase domain-containing protein, partial [Vibrio splendidus]
TNTQTELEKMLSGQVYDGADQKIDIIRTNAKKSLMAFNNHQDPDQQHALQEQLFGKVGSNSLIQPPFHCEFGKTI